jgi:hypothetical protein
LETEGLRLAATDLPTERLLAKKLYEKRLEQLESAHSHSWFGDHSSTYYAGFQPPPPGQSFDVEWGFVPGFHGPRNLGLRIYSRDEIREFLFHDINENVHYELDSLAKTLVNDFASVRDQTLDVLEALSSRSNHRHLRDS